MGSVPEGRAMTKKEETKRLKKIEEQRTRATGSKEKARAFLCRLGVYEEDGTLKKEYRTE